MQCVVGTNLREIGRSALSIPTGVERTNSYGTLPENQTASKPYSTIGLQFTPSRGFMSR